jgi:uncharacterized protein HemY
MSATITINIVKDTATASLLGELTSANLENHARFIAIMVSRLKQEIGEKYCLRIHRTLGKIYHRCGNKTKAIEHLETALRLNPKIGVQTLLKRLISEKEKGDALAT